MAQVKLLGIDVPIEFNEEQVRCFNKVATQTNAMLDRLKTEADIEYNGLIPLFLPFDLVSPYEINVHNDVAFELQMLLPDILDELDDETTNDLLERKRVGLLELV